MRFDDLTSVSACQVSYLRVACVLKDIRGKVAKTLKAHSHPHNKSFA